MENKKIAPTVRGGASISLHFVYQSLTRSLTHKQTNKQKLFLIYWSAFQQHW